VHAPHALRGSDAILQGWGRLEATRTFVCRPAARSDVAGILRDSDHASVTPRGLGRSYGDASYDGEGIVVDSRGMDRFIAFDTTTGLLRCEAGVSFADIVRTCLPQGWFPPTTPGTQFVTVGGAIAADVHGKNHHRVGSLGAHILEFTLLLASGTAVRCARDENAELFFATLGGMGLTGFILDAVMQLRRVETAFVTVDYQRSSTLEESLAFFESGDSRYEHSVAWVDCLAGGGSLGRGVVMRANHAARADLPAGLSADCLALPARRTWSVPCTFPISPLCRWSVKLFNEAFYARHGDGRRLVDVGRFFYPLDSVDGWNRIYGRKGFIQYQAFFPRATSMAGLRELLSRITAAGVASFLAVMKSCGDADGGLLSYLEPGHTLALDIPCSRSAEHMRQLCASFDEVLLRHGGRVYLAKDAMTTAAAFRAMYPRLGEFQRITREVDPSGRFTSALARRLKIVSG
jgi:decaprenylphospho-beta-D-ribofuranose 2-oxidase